MNRRRFLSILAGTAAASTVSYFLPPVGGWHSDVIANSLAERLRYYEQYARDHPPTVEQYFRVFKVEAGAFEVQGGFYSPRAKKIIWSQRDRHSIQHRKFMTGDGKIDSVLNEA